MEGRFLIVCCFFISAVYGNKTYYSCPCSLVCLDSVYPRPSLILYAELTRLCLEKENSLAVFLYELVFVSSLCLPPPLSHNSHSPHVSLCYIREHSCPCVEYLSVLSVRSLLERRFVQCGGGRGLSHRGPW